MSFSGDIMKKQYLIYADESHRKGKYFSNFYILGICLEKVKNMLINKCMYCILEIQGMIICIGHTNSECTQMKVKEY